MLVWLCKAQDKSHTCSAHWCGVGLSIQKIGGISLSQCYSLAVECFPTGSYNFTLGPRQYSSFMRLLNLWECVRTKRSRSVRVALKTVVALALPWTLSVSGWHLRRHYSVRSSCHWLTRGHTCVFPILTKPSGHKIKFKIEFFTMSHTLRRFGSGLAWSITLDLRQGWRLRRWKYTVESISWKRWYGGEGDSIDGQIKGEIW